MKIEQERAELLPCLFCGSRNVAQRFTREASFEALSFVECYDCGARGSGVSGHGGEAIEEWNRRAALQSQDREDAARLDWLDSMNAKLNSHYGTTYRWELVLSPHVVRLMAGYGGSGHVAAIDLNDSAANGVPSCREAIDRARCIEGKTE